jgi:hypothetical protein
VNGVAVSRPRRIGRFLLKELKLALPPTIYFFCAFNLIAFVTNLLVQPYWFALSNFLIATGLALIVGKAILVTNEFSFIDRFRSAPLIKPILYKTIMYSLIVLMVRLLEQLGHFLLDERGFNTAWQAAAQSFTWRHFTAVQVWLAVCFLIYVGVVEVNARLGRGRLMHLLFGGKDIGAN